MRAKNRFAAGFALLIFSGCLAETGLSAAVARRQIAVRLYNYVEAGASDLAVAESEAAGLLKSAGILVTWLHCTGRGRRKAANLHLDCDHSDRSADFYLNALAALPDGFGPVDPNALGFSLIPAGGQSPTTAYLICGRVSAWSARNGFDWRFVLGMVAAHELGHLLEGPGHSAEGLMQSTLGTRELKRALRGQLTFAVLPASPAWRPALAPLR